MTQLEFLQASTALTQQLLESTDFDDATLQRSTPCREFDVAALVEHIIGTHHFLLSAAGGSADDAGSIADRHRAVADQSHQTWAVRGTDGTVDLGGHQLPAEFALNLHALEAFVHGWDLATAVGRPFDPAPELVEMAWQTARVVVSDDSRGTEPGAPYGPAVDAGAEASSLDRLMAFCGRTP